MKLETKRYYISNYQSNYKLDHQINYPHVQIYDYILRRVFVIKSINKYTLLFSL